MLPWFAVVSAGILLQRLPPTARACTQLSRTCGLSLSFTQIRIRVLCLNRVVNNIPPWLSRFLRYWFGCGAFLGLILMLCAPLMLLAALLGASIANAPSSLLSPSSSAEILLPEYSPSYDPSISSASSPSSTVAASPSSRVLHALIPGVTIPPFHVVYLFFVLLISGICHEMGHALAAAAESVRVEASGCFLMVLYPGAFVELHAGLLAMVHPWKQLRIYCAGIWHNAVMAAVSFFLLLYLPCKCQKLDEHS